MRNVAVLSVSLAAAAAGAAAHAAPPTVWASFTTDPQPDGTVTYVFDAFGGIRPDWSTLTPRDPANKASSLASFPVLSNSGLVIAYRDPAATDPVAAPGASQHIVLAQQTNGATPDAAQLILANDLILGDAIDLASRTRTSSFRLAPTGIFATTRVDLEQHLEGIALVQSYTIHNEGTASVELVTVLGSDIDIDAPGGGFAQNVGSHVLGWPGTEGRFPQTVTVLDVTRRYGDTIAIDLPEGAVFDGFKTIRKTGGGIGYELTRASYFYGYPIVGYLNNFYSIPGNGTAVPFTSDTLNDLDADNYADDPGDTAAALQGRFIVPAGGTATVVTRHTLFANGPWLLTCPNGDLAPGETMDGAVVATGGFGDLTLSADGLPDGFVLSGGHIQGVAGAVGETSYTLHATDELGHEDTLECSIAVLGPCFDDPIDQGCTADVVYVVIDGQNGAPSGNARCVHQGTTITCDTNPDGTLRVYEDTWCSTEDR